MTAPRSHLEESQKLTADGEVNLYEIHLKNDPVVFRCKANDTVVWQGRTWEGMGIKMSGDSRSADEEEAKPRLTIVNPAGIFNKPAVEGKIDQAIVVRKRILRRHLDENLNIFHQRMWWVGKIPELISGQLITLELRSMTEGPNFQLPVRYYAPPEFPLVSL